MHLCSLLLCSLLHGACLFCIILIVLTLCCLDLLTCRYTLPPPHCKPFRRMIAHPPVVARLNFLLGYGYNESFEPMACLYPPGTCGGSLHAAPRTHNPNDGFSQVGYESSFGGSTVGGTCGLVGAATGYGCVPWNMPGMPWNMARKLQRDLGSIEEQSGARAGSDREHRAGRDGQEERRQQSSRRIG